jgi:filamentous hemagglutinin family protein
MPLTAALLCAAGATVHARNLIGFPSTSAASSQNGSASAAANSQTATAATTAAAQAVQAAVTARRAQDSLVQSTAAFQSLAQAQAAAHLAALNDSSNIITSTGGSTTDGLGAGLLNPIGGVPTTKASSSIQVVNLGPGGKNQLVLGNGGTVTLPGGTVGTDQVIVSGSGSVTTTGGTVQVTAGNLSTTSGGTLSATNGGSISLTAGSGTLSASTSATITSTLAGTVTLPAGAGTMALSANQSMTIPAGSSVKFTGSGTGTVLVSGAGTLTLAGAGTLALSNTTASAGGTISTGSGTSSFTGNGSVSSQAPGATISLSGSGSINFDGSGSDSLPLILQPTAAQTPPAFTTTGTLLTTLSYNLPVSSVSSQSWTGVGALSQSINGSNGQTTVTITQNQPQALLTWQTFNVGRNTTLDFDQSAGGASEGDWVAINRILDPSLSPSEILGAIEAPGQVYVINQNGIIFNGASQVNTHALVASTLPINSNLVANGLLNNPAGQFLFTSIAITPRLTTRTAIRTLFPTRPAATSPLRRGRTSPAPARLKVWGEK